MKRFPQAKGTCSTGETACQHTSFFMMPQRPKSHSTEFNWKSHCSSYIISNCSWFEQEFSVTAQQLCVLTSELYTGLLKWPYYVFIFGLFLPLWFWLFYGGFLCVLLVYFSLYMIWFFFLFCRLFFLQSVILSCDYPHLFWLPCYLPNVTHQCLI